MSDRENSIGEKADTALHDRIKLRAYELYQSRGSVNGSDLQDWLQAEREVLSQSEPAGESTAVPSEGKRRVVKAG
jgi:DUF2934 family protein